MNGGGHMLRGLITMGTRRAQRREEDDGGVTPYAFGCLLPEGLHWPCLPAPGREKPIQLSLGLLWPSEGSTSDFPLGSKLGFLRLAMDAASLLPNLASAPLEDFLAGPLSAGPAGILLLLC